MEDIIGQSSKIDVISGQVDRINESKMYRTELVTEGVSIFREKTQRSTVRCKVYSWDNEITDTLPASAFNWHRNSGNTEADAAWDAVHTGTSRQTTPLQNVIRSRPAPKRTLGSSTRGSVSFVRR